MDGKRFLLKIRLQNVLSYGAAGAELGLEPLNVLIGSNGAGKSNLIEILGLLAAVPQDLSKAIREGGGVDEWLWKGDPLDGICIAEIFVEVMSYFGPLSYDLGFTSSRSRLQIVGEELVDLGDGRDLFPYGFAAREGESILAAFRDPVNHPKLSVLAGQLGLIRLFRGWNLGNPHP